MATSSGNIVGYYFVAGIAYALKSAIAFGCAIAVAAAAIWDFQEYKFGVVNGTPCGTLFNQGIVDVGLGQEGGIEYFLIRSSCRPDWGPNGYIKFGIVGGACGSINDSDNPSPKFSGDPPSPPEFLVPEPAPIFPPVLVPSACHYGKFFLPERWSEIWDRQGNGNL